MGDEGSYDVYIVESASNAYYKNMFKGTLEGTTLYTTDGDYTNYYLSKGDAGVGFYKVTKEDGVKMGANRCYLQIPYHATSGARGMTADATPIWSDMIFSDGGDDIIAIPLFADGTTNIQSSMFNVQSDEVYYNFQGQRVTNPGKGVYIKNGKKVVVR